MKTERTDGWRNRQRSFSAEMSSAYRGERNNSVLSYEIMYYHDINMDTPNDGEEICVGVYVLFCIYV